jgi:hypothetical protein
MNPNVENSFQLEQDILACWNITSDIDTLFAAVFEKDLSQDEIANVLLGLKSLYDLKFEKLFATFEEVHRNVCEKN